jgi:hypothetical protein
MGPLWSVLQNPTWAMMALGLAGLAGAAAHRRERGRLTALA